MPPPDETPLGYCYVFPLGTQVAAPGGNPGLSYHKPFGLFCTPQLVAYQCEKGGGCKLHFAYCLSGGLVVALAGGLGLAILPKGG